MALATGRFLPRFGPWLASVFRDSSAEQGDQPASQPDTLAGQRAAFETCFRRYEPQLTGYL